MTKLLKQKRSPLHRLPDKPNRAPVERLEPRLLFTGSIEGQLFADPDRDGVLDTGELGIEGWAVYIDANHNQARDAGEVSDVTDSTGAYALTGVADGTHTVIVDAPTGWGAVSPTGLVQSVAVAGAGVTGVDFGVLPRVTAAVDPSLRAHWLFEKGSGDTAIDTSGRQNHADLNHTAWLSDTERGSVLAFDGTSSYAVSDTLVLDPTVTATTGSAWIKLDQLPTTDSAIILTQQDDGSGGAGRVWLEVDQDGSLRSYLGATYTTSGAILSTGVWHHVAVTQDSGMVRVYFDGQEVASEQQNVELTSGGFVIGSHKDTTSHYLDGVVDDVRVYDRALSASEIEAFVPPDVRDTTVRGHWLFEEGAGAVANDASGNQNHADLTNTAWLDDAARGSVLGFDGSTSYAKSDVVVFDPSISALTAAAWVRLDQLPTSAAAIILSQDDGSATGRTWLEVGAVDDKLRSNLGGVQTGGGPALQAGAWYHVAVTHDAGTVRVYLDGEEIASGQRTVESADGALVFGSHKSTTSNYLDGVIDDIRVYNRAMSDLEIEALAGETAVDSTLKARWQFEEGVGLVASDGSGSQNHLDLINAAWVEDADHGSAIAFNGAGYAKSDTPAFDPSTTDLSAGLWVRLDQLPASGNNAALLAQEDGSGTGRSWLYVDSAGNLNTYLGGTATVAGTHLKANRWYHLAVTVESGTVRLYLDGSEVASASRTIESSDGKMVLGAHKDQAQSFLDGLIDDAQIYDRALSASEVRTIARPSAVDPSLISHWLFEDGSGIEATDSSGRQNHAGLTNTAWEDDPLRGSVLGFNGTSSYAESGTLLFDPSTTDFTGSAWVKLDQLPASDGAVIFTQQDDGGGGVGRIWLQITTDGKLYSYLGGTSTYSGKTLQADHWYHVAVTQESGMVRFYLDGQEVARAQQNIEVTNGGFVIGANKTKTSHFLDGLIDDARVYDRALSASEIEALVNPAALDPTLVGYWRFEEGFGSQVTDSSGNQNHVELTSTAWVDDPDLGSVVYFDGTASTAESQTSALDPNRTSLSAAAWVRLYDMPSAETFVLLSQKDGSGLGRTWLNVNTDGNLRTNLGGSDLSGSTPLRAGVWHHVAVTAEGGAVRLFLDGEELASGQFSVELADGAMVFGTHKDQLVSHHHGLIEEVRVYSRALTALEIRSIAVPVVAIAGPGYSDEDAPLTLTSTIRNASPGDQYLYDWSARKDGGVFDLTGTAADGSVLSLTPADPGVYTFTLSVTNPLGGVGVAEYEVVVEEQSGTPTLTLGAGPAVAGTPYTVALGRGTVDETITEWTIDWGDGTVVAVSAPGSGDDWGQGVVWDPVAGVWEATHTYADGPVTALVSAIAGDGVRAFSAAAQPLQVGDPGRVITIGTAGPVLADELFAPALTIDADAHDAVRDWWIDWGDGTVQTMGFDAAGNPAVPDHAYDDAGDYTITAYAVDDDGQYKASTTVTVADAPVDLISDDAYTVAYETPLYALGSGLGLLGNDAADPVLDWTITLIHPTDPSQNRTMLQTTGTVGFSTEHGVLNISADGAFDYTPDAGFSGVDSFYYKMQDNATGDIDYARVRIVVRADNDNSVPAGVDETRYVGVGQAVAVTERSQGLLGRVTDPDGDVLAFDTTPGSNNFASLPGLSVDLLDGTFAYNPADPTFTGDIVIEYAVTDGDLTSSSQRLTLRYVNSAPVVLPSTFTAVADEPVVIAAGAGLLAQASDEDGDTLAITEVAGQTADFTGGQPDTFALASGTLEVFEDGAYTFTPAAGFVGQQSFTFTVSDGNDSNHEAASTVTIELVTGLVVVADDSYTGRTNVTIPVSAETGVLANDANLLDLPLTIETPSIVTDEGVSVTLAADGSFNYTPLPGFEGEDGFRYTVSDVSGSTYTAEVVIYVESEPPAGIDDLYIVGLGQSIDLDLLANDLAFADGQALSVTPAGLSAPEVGSLSEVNPGTQDGLYRYQAPTDWAGQFTLAYAVTDGIEASEPVEVEIVIVADGLAAIPDDYEVSHGQTLTIDAASGLLANDLGPAGLIAVQDPVNIAAEFGSVTVSADGSLVYTPATGFVGEDTFEYDLTDGTGDWVQATATVYVTNDTPTAPTLQATVVEDGSVALALPGADTDPTDAPALTYEVLAEPAYGTIDTTAWTYTPEADYVGPDSFVYLVTDTLGESALGIVEIEVTAVNDLPAVDPVSVTVNPDGVLSLNLAPYVTDAEDDALAFTVVSGTAAVTADGLLTFDPAGVAGQTVLGLQVSDGTTPVAFDVTVDAVNTAPVGVADSFGVFQDTTLTIDAGSGVLSNDQDDFVDSVTAVGSTTTIATANGSVTLNPDGSFSYTPNTGYTGTDSFTYTPDDGHATGSATTVTFNVSNSEVVASADRYVAHAGSTLVIGRADQGVLRNDQASAGTLTVTSSDTTTAQGGSVTVNSDGTFTYTAPDTLVEDSFTYTAGNGTDTDTVTVAIALNNVAPGAASDRYEVNAHADAQNPTVLDRDGAGQGLLLNDYDADGDTLAVTQFNGQAVPTGSALSLQVSDPGGTVQGTFEVYRDGRFTFTPAEGYTGLVEASYTISDGIETGSAAIEIRVVNSLPTAGDDGFRFHHSEVQRGEDADGDVLANDYDYDGHALVAVAEAAQGQAVDLAGGGTITTSNGGTVDLNADGTFTYTASDGFVGRDTFTYAAYDGIQDEASLDWVAVRIDVWNRLSLPAGDTFYFTHPYAPAGAALTGDVLANDVEALDSTVGSGYNKAGLIDPATGEAVAAGTAVATSKGGQVTLQEDGSFSYTPKADWSAGDATRTPGGFTGTDSFTYVIQDEVEQTAPVTVQLVVSNRAPQAVDDVFMIRQSLDAAGDVMAANGQVLSNDWDAEGDGLTLDLSHYNVTIETEDTLDPQTGQPTGGTIEFVVVPTVKGGQAKLRADGSFVYTGPDNAKGFDGVDSFDYRLLDGASHSLRSDLGSITGTVRIYAVNNIIQATDDFHIVQMGDFAGMDGLALITNDYLGGASASDFEIEVIAGSLSVENGHGEVAIDGHTFKYTPKKTADPGSPADPFQHGEVSFRYRLTQKVVLPNPSDPLQSVELVVARSEAAVTLVIQPPLYRAADDYTPVGKNGVGGNLLENDYQDTPANSAIEPTIKTGTFETQQGGSVTIFSNGAFTYIPPSTDYGIFNGMDSFEYTAGWGDPTDPSVGLVGESTAEVVIAYQGASVTGTLDSDTVKSTGQTFAAGGSNQALHINDDLLRLFYSQDTIDNELNTDSFAVKHDPWLAHADEFGQEVRIQEIGRSLPLTGTVTDALTFTVANNDGVFSDFTVTWQVSPPEPDVTNDVAYTQPGTKVVIDVLANDGIKTQYGGFDTGLAADLVTLLQVTNQGGLNGTAAFVNNKLEYTPNAGMTGPETIDYAVTVGATSYAGKATVHVATQAPPALQAADDTLPTVALGTNTTGGTSGLFNLLANDTDGAGGAASPARVYIVEQGQYGYASSTDGLYNNAYNVSYEVHQRPDTNDVTDTITYAIEDKWGNVSTASVTVQVTTDPIEPATTASQTYSYTPSSTHSVTLASGQAWTWRSGDHQIYVDASSGGATISFANNAAVVTSADAGTRLKVIRSGDPAGTLSVGWAGAGAGNTLEVTNSGQVAGMTFAGDLKVTAGVDIDQNYTAKSLEITATGGASVAGTHRATGTTADDDLTITRAHHVGGSLTAENGSVVVRQGTGAQVTGDVHAAVTAGKDIQIAVSGGVHQSVKGALSAGGAVEIRGDVLVDTTVTYGTSLDLRADHGDIRGTYTNTDQANGGFATVTAVNIDATFNNASQDSTFRADHDLAGTIRGGQVNDVIAEHGTVSATLEIENLSDLRAGLDFTGKAAGGGVLESLLVGRDLSGSIDYHTIDRGPSDWFDVGRDFTSTGSIKAGAGGIAVGTFDVGRTFAGTLISEGVMNTDLKAGLDLNGTVTALNATDAINIEARRSIGITLNTPKAYIWNVKAGDYDHDSDLEARGSINGAKITASGIGDIEVYGGWGITEDDAGRIIDTAITLHADQPDTGFAYQVGVNGWALKNVMATGAVQGLSINIQRQSAADKAIELIETGSRSDAASSLSVVTQGAVGTIHAKRGDLTLTKLHAGGVTKIHTDRGGLAITDGNLKQGIDELMVYRDLTGALKAEQGDLGAYNSNYLDNPSIAIGGGVDAVLSAVAGDVGWMVTGLVSAGSVAGSIKAEQGLVRGVENRGGSGSPFVTRSNHNPLTAAHKVTRGKELDLPDWYISTYVGNPIASLFFKEPELLYKPGYAAAGHISADISARAIGSVHATGDLSGKINADHSIDDLWVFGDVTGQSTIASGAGSITASVWGDAKAGTITAKHNAVLNVHGDLESVVTAELGGINANVWGEIGGGAQLRAKGNISTWSRGVTIAGTIESKEGDLYIDSWSDIQVDSLDGKEGRLRAYGDIDGKTKAGSKINITSSSLGNQSWDYNGAMQDQVLVSRGNTTISGATYSFEKLFYAVVGGNLTINNELTLTKETASATLLVKGEFKGDVSIRQSGGDKTNPEHLRGYLKADVGSIAAGSELAAKTMVLAVNGDVNANTDANTKFYAADYLGLDAQGMVKGKYTAGQGQAQILAGQDFDATVKAQLGAVVNARGSVTGEIISDGGAVFVASFNSPDGNDAGVDATLFAHSQASVQSFGTTKIKEVTSGPGGRITNGGLEVFSVGDILNGTRLTAGGDVGVESWGSIDAFIEASAYDLLATPDPDEQPTEYAASVTAHGDLTGAIYAGGDIQAVALNNLNALMQSDLGSISAQAGGTLQNTFRAATNIDLIANTIDNALAESSSGQVSAIALTNATFEGVRAKGDIQLIAGNDLTVANGSNGTIKATGETDAQGEPTLEPSVTLIADQGALSATVAAGHGNVSAYAGQAADLTTQTDGTIAAPLTVSVIAQGDITGSLAAQDSITAMALDAIDPTASPAETHSPASINLTGVTASADGSSVYLFADGAIGGASFAAAAKKTLIASANDAVQGDFTAGSGGVSISSLTSINADATTNPSTGGSISLFTGGVAHGQDADLSTYTIAGSVSADGDAELFAAGKITAPVTAGGSASVSALGGDITGSITANGADGTLSVFSGVAEVPEQDVDGTIVPAHDEGGSVTGTLTAAGELSLLAAADLTGNATAHGDAEVLVLGDQAGTVTTATGDLSLYAGDVSAALTATAGSAAVTSGSDISANITAATGLTALAANSITADLAVTGTGDLEAIALGSLTGSVTAGAGDISAVVGGQFTAALDADSTTTGPIKGGGVDALAMASFAGSIDAEADASVTVLGNSTGTLHANQNASASGPGAASTLTVIGDGASAGDITGSVTSAFGSLTV
ncbi:MAG: Ig-like domain-containing protein, partial [Planctomycetota bacterium]